MQFFTRLEPVTRLLRSCSFLPNGKNKNTWRMFRVYVVHVEVETSISLSAAAETCTFSNNGNKTPRFCAVFRIDVRTPYVNRERS